MAADGQPSPGTPRSQRVQQVAFANLPTWIKDALDTQDDAFPATLGVGAVVPVVDAFQQGWGVARFPFSNVISAGASSTNVVIPMSRTLIRRITAVTYIADGTVVGDATFLIRPVDDGLAPLSAIFKSAVTVTVAGSFTDAQCRPNGDEWLVPPGYQFVWGALGAADILRVSWIEAPAGFKL